jgi:transcriptional regulator with XRE-family HTH domain
MNSNDQELVERLCTLKGTLGLTQVQLAAHLGVDQGHISKILRGKAAVSKKMASKINAILAMGIRSPKLDSKFEGDLIQAVRSSSDFLELMQAALKLHKSNQ